MTIASSVLLALLQLDAPPTLETPQPWTLTAPLLPSSSTVRTLPLQIASSRPVEREDAWPDGCGPGPVLIAMSATSMLVGAPQAIPFMTTSTAELREELTRLMMQRPDRQQIVLQVDDDVDLDAVVAVIDTALGVELSTTLSSSSSSRFGLGQWLVDPG